MDDTPAHRERAGAVTPSSGLTSQQVLARIGEGRTNAFAQPTSRTIAGILRENIVTRFNFLLGSLLVLIVVAGDLRDALFGIVLLANALIGIVQELRAKRTLDRLAILNAPRARVVRDAERIELAVDDVVLDDLVLLSAGEQVVADGVVLASTGLQLDESLLSGESLPVDKVVGDDVRSGSIVVAGSGAYQALGVGAQAYVHRLTTEAKRFELVHSELMAGINRLLRYVSIAVVPVAVLIITGQLRAGLGWRQVVTGVVTGLVAMVPQGLVLLTSISFGVAAVSLARQRVLVQELAAIEALARVDVVCLDKTGTLTDGRVAFERLERREATDLVDGALGALAQEEQANATLSALAETFSAPPGWRREATVAFSSERKWSAASFAERGSWILGAPEIVLEPTESEALARADELAGTGRRVLALCHSPSSLSGTSLPTPRRWMALVLLAEHVRPDAAATLAYFSAQGVKIKVISGDSAATVGAIAQQLGVPGAEEPVDARTMPSEAGALAELVEDRGVFGRVTPQQKSAMVAALRARGHTVAMTGDGVNDALALKAANLGIAMGSGAPATRAVAQVVLLDGQFSRLPRVLADGRRVTANIERVASLFIVKSVWATLLGLAIGVAAWPFPLLPRHLTVIDALAIGIPAFFIALAPNPQRYVPGFVTRVLGFSVPAGTVIFASILASYWLAHARGLPLIQQRSGAALGAFLPSLVVLGLLARPLSGRRVLLVAIMVGAFAMLFPVAAVRDFYALSLPTRTLGLTFTLSAVASGALVLIWLAGQRRQPELQNAPPPPGEGPGGGTGSDERRAHEVSGKQHDETHRARQREE